SPLGIHFKAHTRVSAQRVDLLALEPAVEIKRQPIIIPGIAEVERDHIGRAVCDHRQAAGFARLQNRLDILPSGDLPVFSSHRLISPRDKHSMFSSSPQGISRKISGQDRAHQAFAFCSRTSTDGACACTTCSSALSSACPRLSTMIWYPYS